MYRRTYGWDVEGSDECLTLRTGLGLVAVRIAACVAPAVVGAARAIDAVGPVLRYGDDRPWVFLADGNDLVIADSHLPACVVGLPLGTELRIPGPDGGTDDVLWAVAPNRQRRWLPTLAAVLVCARYVERRAARPTRAFPPLRVLKGA